MKQALVQTHFTTGAGFLVRGLGDLGPKQLSTADSSLAVASPHLAKIVNDPANHPPASVIVQDIVQQFVRPPSRSLCRRRLPDTTL